MSEAKRVVTVIYCSDSDLGLFRKKQSFAVNDFGEMIIPQDFKQGKTIVALCDGDVNILNSIGDRLVSQ
ncbi:TIGR02922 family protein [Colwellia sp. RSH04]|uniref:TIGR02922 family protein n=1 Tax=Colwellia sp. RSH04 TaxID=2305464 RepID=UPI000E573526|nr:TIGR02922 family protein [Colwellia sp. RSH04]RHW77535.1 TIGR02922 family protein [Colwellia sp. RSH04]